MYKIALIPGTFDPITTGHLHLIKHASERFDKVVVGIFINPNKNPMFTIESRKKAIEFATKDIPNVTVITNEGYVADYAKENGISAIVKGFRNIDDYVYEKKMAIYNKEHSGVDTYLIESEKDYSQISSTMVRNQIIDKNTTPDGIPIGILDILEQN